MFRYINLLILLVASTFVLGQDCPSNPDVACVGCDAGFSEPTFTETTTPTELDHVCDITLSWDEQVFEVSPRMTFTCSYDDGSLCYGSEEDVCASCGNVTFAGLNSFRFPMITYSDTCGNINIFPVAEDCVVDASTTVDPMGCKKAFEFIGGRCLFVDPFLDATWDEARYFCAELGSSLAMINSDQLYLDILEYIYANSIDNRDYWIGANDRFSDGTFTWLNGVAMQLGTPYWAVFGLGNNFYVQEPADNGTLNYDCVQMDGSRFLYYDDDNCDNSKAAICEHY